MKEKFRTQYFETVIFEDNGITIEFFGEGTRFENNVALVSTTGPKHCRYYPYGAISSIDATIRLGAIIEITGKDTKPNGNYYTNKLCFTPQKGERKRLKNAVDFAQKQLHKAPLEHVTETVYEEDEEMKELEKMIDKIMTTSNEIRKRCNVCGHIFCFNNDDIKKNKSNARRAVLSSISGAAGALGGAYTASAVNQTNAQNSLNRLVDFNRCPQCNSTNLSVISYEEFEKMQAQNQEPQQPVAATVSIADEIKKFKDLLDMGAITQEEFDAKKKDLLGL